MVTKYGSVKRFGVRYGRRTKERFGKVESEYRKKHNCPFCHKVGVKRVSLGVWECRKCNVRFTGAAYVPSGKVIKEELFTAAKEAEKEVA